MFCCFPNKMRSGRRDTPLGEGGYVPATWLGRTRRESLDPLGCLRAHSAAARHRETAPIEERQHRRDGVMTRRLIAICLALLWSFGACEAAPKRVALVVGAAAYTHAARLAHTIEDARGVAAALEHLGFEVELVLDPDRASLEGAVRRLGKRAQGAEASLFYYSGHALEAGGTNWLVPVRRRCRQRPRSALRDARSRRRAGADQGLGASVADLPRRLP